MSFSVTTTDVEFEDCIAFAILQFCIRTLRTFMIVLALIEEKIFTEAFLFGRVTCLCTSSTGGVLERVPPENV